MSIGYRIVERFDPASPSWPKYIEWSKLAQLIEVVGLDCALCPAVTSESAADWEHLLYVEYLPAVFDDWQYARSKLSSDRNPDSLQVLAVLREPTKEQVRELAPAGFDFVGFELIEEATSISALTNCGGFNDVFPPAHLNEHGLISDLLTAQDIRLRLRVAHPDEAHANCAVWAVWRKAPNLES